MNRVKGPARLGFAAALLALLLAPLALGFHSAHAQGVDTAYYYGSGLSAGDAVGVTLGGAECASTTADADGNWTVTVGASDACDLENEVSELGFTVNGVAAEQTVVWEEGGLPADDAGITLTVAEVVEPEPDPDPEPENGNGMPAPEPGEPGQAGLATSAASSSLLALALGILAVAGIAAARVSTRRVS